MGPLVNGTLVNETKINAPRNKNIQSLRAILGIALIWLVNLAYIGLWLDEGGNYVLIVFCCPHSNQFLVRSGWVCYWLMRVMINRNTIPVFRYNQGCLAQIISMGAVFQICFNIF